MIEAEERIIYKCADEFGDIHVAEKGLIRTLYFGNEKKQSCVFLPDPTVLVLHYAQAMTTSILLNPNPKKILIVGLGGGSLLQFISKVYPNAKIEVLELREKVIELSHEFFYVPEEIPNVKIICTDAKDYIEKKTKKNSQEYDLMLIDAFDAWGPSELTKDENFLTACQAMLTCHGVMSINLWNRKEDYFNFVSRRLSSLFNGGILQLKLGKVDSNVIVFCFADHEKAQEITKLKTEAAEQKENLGIDYVRFVKLLASQNFSFVERIKKRVSI